MEAQANDKYVYVALRICKNNDVEKDSEMLDLICEDLTTQQIKQCDKLKYKMHYGLIEITDMLQWDQVTNEYKDEQLIQAQFIERYIMNEKDKLRQKEEAKMAKKQEQKEKPSDNKKTSNKKSDEFNPYCFSIGQVIELEEGVPFTGTGGDQSVGLCPTKDLIKILRDPNVPDLRPICKRIVTCAGEATDQWDMAIKGDLQKNCIECIKKSFADIYLRIFMDLLPQMNKIGRQIYDQTKCLPVYLDEFGVTQQEIERYVSTDHYGDAQNLCEIAARPRHLDEVFKGIKLKIHASMEGIDEGLVLPPTQKFLDFDNIPLNETDDENDADIFIQHEKERRRKHKKYKTSYIDLADEESETQTTDSDIDILSKNGTRKKRKSSKKRRRSKSPQKESKSPPKKKKKPSKQKQENDDSEDEINPALAVEAGGYRYICGVKVRFPKAAQDYRKIKFECPVSPKCQKQSITNWPKHLYKHIAKDEIILDKPKPNNNGCICSKKCCDENKKLIAFTSAKHWFSHLRICDGEAAMVEGKQFKLPKFARDCPDTAAVLAFDAQRQREEEIEQRLKQKKKKRKRKNT